MGVCRMLIEVYVGVIEYLESKKLLCHSCSFQ